jgi:hypothetical protein
MKNMTDGNFDSQTDGIFRQNYLNAAYERTKTIRRKRHEPNYNPTFAEVVCGTDSTEPMVYSHKGPIYNSLNNDKWSFKQQKEINKEFRDLIAGK